VSRRSANRRAARPVFRSPCQRHRKHGSQHHVSGCGASRNRLRWRLRSVLGTTADRMAAHRRLDAHRLNGQVEFEGATVWSGFAYLINFQTRPCQRSKSKRDGLQKLELHRASRINHCCAASMSIARLSRCLWTGSRFDAGCLYRDPASADVNRRKFHTEWPGFARISARGHNLPEHFCSGFQRDVSFHRNVLS
jgi:hypothetical protein